MAPVFHNLLNIALSMLQDYSDRVPYRFTYIGKDSRIDIPNNIYETVFKSSTQTIEDSISIQHTPQDVFRVRAVSRCSSSIPGHGEAILCTAFAPSSSSRFLTGSGDNIARLWDTDTGTPLHTLRGHSGWVLVVSWSPDEKSIATGSMDKTVRLWNPVTGEPLGNPLKGHTQRVNSIAYEPYHSMTPGRPRLASSSQDCTVRIWDITSKHTDAVLSGHLASISCVKWGGTGRIYTASRDKTVKVWEADKHTLIHTLAAHSHWVNHLALSTDFVLRTAYHDHTGTIPATDAAKVKKAKERFDKAALIENKTVERLVTASDDQKIHIWEPSKSTKPIKRLDGHNGTVSHVTFSPDGLYIASSGWDNHVKLWWAEDGKFITAFRGHVGDVYMSCFSPDSRLLVSGSKDTTLKVWDVNKRKLKEDLPGHKDAVFAVDWSPDGAKVGSGGNDKAVKIWRH